MKILNESLLLNSLKDTLDLIEEPETYIIKRVRGKDAVLMSVDEYNELKRQIYEANNKRML